MWNIRKLLDEFGTDYRSRIREALRPFGFSLSHDAIKKWRHRNSIPSDALAALFVARPDLDPRDFLVDPNAENDPSTAWMD